MEHSENNETSVEYLDPRMEYADIAKLAKDPQELALMLTAVRHFLDNPDWAAADRANLAQQWKRRGWNMFIWKYYAAARMYIGGYKALSANLMLRRF